MKQQSQLQHAEKLQIVNAAKQYLELHSQLSQNKLAEKAGVNSAYLSVLFKGQFEIGGAGKKSPVKDSIFFKIANVIGHKVEKVYWETVVTPQFKQMIVTLSDAKQNGRTAVLLGDPGSGKSYTLKIFEQKNPVHTYRITVSSVFNLNDLLNEILAKLHLETSGTKARRLLRIAGKLKDIKLNGGKPIVIFDEAENLKIPALQAIKGLYDGVRDYCSIVLVGTDQLWNNLEKLRLRNKQGMPQFFRRFKAGHRWLPEMDKSFTVFLDKYSLDSGLKKLLCRMCDNYGELNDYLEPFLREADLRGEKPTEELFRIIYQIPPALKKVS
jgi:DNA transposition AAA+ family ATPase